MAEDKPEEEKKPEEKNPKTAGEMAAAASTLIKYLESEGFSIEEGICVFALASSLTQVEIMMQTILKDAKVMAMPMPHPGVMVQKPSSN